MYNTQKKKHIFTDKQCYSDLSKSLLNGNETLNECQ